MIEAGIAVVMSPAAVGENAEVGHEDRAAGCLAL